MNTCECGCGAIVAHRFVSGHNAYGKKCSKETREKIGAANRGRVYTKEQIEAKNTAGRTPKKRNACATASLRPGSVHYKKWTFEHLYLMPWQLRLIVKGVLDRDKHKCIRCGKLEKTLAKPLEVHHVVPVLVGRLSRICDSASNLVSICRACHRAVEPRNAVDKEDRWRLFLPFAYRYLSQFGYKRMLLRRYYRQN